jgi:hypothetical protein
MPQSIPLLEICEKFTLTTNMRVHLTGDASAATFFEQLLMLGDGKAPPDPNTGHIQFPHNFCNIACSVDELKANVFPDIHHNYRRHEWLCERLSWFQKMIVSIH